MNKYKLVFALADVCEYVYRKGVADAASSGDTVTAMEMADRDDKFTTFQFINENFGLPLPYEHYKDFLIVFSSHTKSAELRGFLVYMRGMEKIKRAMCIITDFMYRKGLRDGCTQTKEVAIDYLKSYKARNIHKRLNAPSQSGIQWVEEIKHSANTIYNVHKFYKIKTSMQLLSIFIGEAILESKISQNYGLK